MRSKAIMVHCLVMKLRKSSLNIKNVKVKDCRKTKQPEDCQKDKINKKFLNLFHGMGKLQNFEAKQHIDSFIP